MTKREKARRARERERLADEEALWRELQNERAEERFEGHIDAHGLWKVPRDKFVKKQLSLLDIWKEDEPNLAKILTAAYHDGAWKNSSGLQGYMRGGSANSYKGKRPRDAKGRSIPAPDSGYLVRLCIAYEGGDSSHMLDDEDEKDGSSPILEAFRPSGLNNKTHFTCVNCRRKFIALCPRCRNQAKRLRRRPLGDGEVQRPAA